MSIDSYVFSIEWKQWYLEYQRGQGIRFHFYICIMFNNWPLLVWCKFDNPEDIIRDWNLNIIQILIFKFTFITKSFDENIKDIKVYED